MLSFVVEAHWTCLLFGFVLAACSELIDALRNFVFLFLRILGFSTSRQKPCCAIHRRRKLDSNENPSDDLSSGFDKAWFKHVMTAMISTSRVGAGPKEYSS